MKYCPGCKMKVGGDFEHCPLCQNELQGEGEENVFPYAVELHRQSFLFKLQLFLCLAALVIILALDFLLNIKGERHWSIIALVGVAGLQVVIQAVIRRRLNPSKIIWYITLGAGALTAYIFYFLSAMPLYLQVVLPAICLASLVLHFIFAMTDKAKNALAYYLVNVLVTVIPPVALLSVRRDVPFVWSLCLMAGVVSLLAMVIFRGRRVLAELQKRFNF